MSGHSKWSQIRRQKEANDLKKGSTYTKIAKQIVLAARHGADPAVNFSLRIAMDRAKAVNMPVVNIEKAIKKGTGEDKSNAVIEQVTYEAYGFGGAVFLIDALTDNRNRSAADIRMIVEKHGGRMVEAGAVSWQFTPRGIIEMYTQTQEEEYKLMNRKWNDVIAVRKLPSDKVVVEEFEMRLIEIDGVADVVSEFEEGIYLVTIYTTVETLDSVRKAIEAMGYDVEHIEMIKKANNEISLDEEAVAKNKRLIDIIEENDDVDTLWHNIANI